MAQLKITQVEDDKYVCNDDYEDCRKTGKKITKFYFSLDQTFGSVVFLPKKPCVIKQMWLKPGYDFNYILDFAATYARDNGCKQIEARFNEHEKDLFPQEEIKCNDIGSCRWLKLL